MNISNIRGSELFPATADTQVKIPSIGQVWRDANGDDRASRRMLILSVTPKAVAYQEIDSGAIRTVRREQFNRGECGFKYCGQINQLLHDDLQSVFTHLTQKFVTNLAHIING